MRPGGRLTAGSGALTLGSALGAALLVGAVVPASPLVALVVAALAALGIVLLTRPEVAVLVVVFLLYVNAPAVAIKFHGAPLILGALVLLLLVLPAGFALFRGEGLVVTRPFLLILAFLAVQLAATATSRAPFTAMANVKTFLIEGILLVLLVLNAIRTVGVLRQVIWTLLAGGACLAAVSLFQQVTGTFSRPYGGFGQVQSAFFTGHASEARLAGPIGDPNYYAQILLVLIPLGLLGLSGERSPRLRLVAIAVTTLVTAAVILTFSRGAGLAFLVIFAIMAGLRYVKPRQAVAIVAAVAVGLAVVPEYRDRLTSLTAVGGATEQAGSDAAADISVRSRTTEMLAAVLVFADHPVLGVGAGVFPSYYQEYANRVGLQVLDAVGSGEREGEAARRESHNMFLSVAADLGIAGLVVFIGIISLTLADLVRARRRWLATRPDLANLATGFLLAVVGFVTMGLFLTLAFERYFWLLIALSGVAAHLLLKEEPAEAVAAPAPTRSQRRRGPPGEPVARPAGEAG